MLCKFVMLSNSMKLVPGCNHTFTNRYDVDEMAVSKAEMPSLRRDQRAAAGVRISRTPPPHHLKQNTN